MRPLHLLLLAVAIFLVPTAGYADDVRWRESYADAYAESNRTGKPMFMEFTADTCYWCKRLEATTLSTPEIAKLINERFIPVKIDAQVEVDLARAVAVQALPTLFVLAPDRTILNRYEGYAEPPPILQFLKHGLERSPPPAIARTEDK